MTTLQTVLIGDTSVMLRTYVYKGNLCSKLKTNQIIYYYKSVVSATTLASNLYCLSDQHCSLRCVHIYIYCAQCFWKCNVPGMMFDCRTDDRLPRRNRRTQHWNSISLVPSQSAITRSYTFSHRACKLLLETTYYPPLQMICIMTLRKIDKVEIIAFLMFLQTTKSAIVEC